MQEASQPDDVSLVLSVAASIPGYIFRFCRSANGGERLDYVSPGFDQIWELAPNEDRTDPVVHWSRVFEDDLEGFQASIEQAIQTGVWDFRYRIWLPSGGQKWLHGQGKAMLSEDGGVVIDGMILDVTDQIQVEQDLKATQERLAHAQKMEAIGNLTAGIAHDFNNLLAVVLGNLELMDYTTERGDFEDMQEQAIKAVLKGKSLTSSLLSFARKSKLDLKTIDVVDALKSIEVMVKRTLFENIRIETVFRSEPLLTVTDANLLENAILNLALNSRDTMEHGGVLTLEAGRAQIGLDGERGTLEPLPPGNYVEVVVRDTGQGMTDEDLVRVCEPFFTTKEPGQGSGLGLSMVQGFVAQAGGQMRIASQTGKGTSVHLFLPEALKDTSVKGTRSGQGSRILYIEDETDVRIVTSRILKSLGYDVVAVSNPVAAKKAIERDQPFAAAVIDNYLGSSVLGKDLARQIRSEYPDCAILILSGLQDKSLDGIFEDDSKCGFLQKPAGREELRSALDTLVKQYPRRI